MYVNSLHSNAVWTDFVLPNELFVSADAVASYLIFILLLLGDLVGKIVA